MLNSETHNTDNNTTLRYIRNVFQPFTLFLNFAFQQHK